MDWFQEDNYGSFGGLVFDAIPLDEVDVIIQGIPYESGTSGKKGSSFGPSSIRLISKDMQTLSRRGVNLNKLTLRDMGNVDINPVEGEITRNNIEQAMNSLLSQSEAPIISIGGDHSIVFPLVKPLANR
ncbi:MAG: arginase family protein [Candidatus Kariarchaeaceae archaeon]